MTLSMTNWAMREEYCAPDSALWSCQFYFWTHSFMYQSHALVWWHNTHLYSSGGSIQLKPFQQWCYCHFTKPLSSLATMVMRHLQLLQKPVRAQPGQLYFRSQQDSLRCQGDGRWCHHGSSERSTWVEVHASLEFCIEVGIVFLLVLADSGKRELELKGQVDTSPFPLASPWS